MVKIAKSLDEVIHELIQQHNFSEASIKLLQDKGFETKEYQDMVQVMELSDQTFSERKEEKDDLEVLLDRGNAVSIF